MSMPGSFDPFPPREPTLETPLGCLTRVDTHAHFYETFPRDTFLDTAKRRLVCDQSHLGVVLLAEPDTSRHPLSRIRQAVSPLDKWALQPVDDERVMRCDREGVPQLFLIASRQLTSNEGLEVLALCCDHSFPQRAPLENLLHAISAAGGVGVIPWGFGKWWGRRGRLLKHLFQRDDRPTFLLGDTGGRPNGPCFESLFRQATHAGIRCIAGSDPLPWAAQVHRVGRYATELPGPISPHDPVAWVRQQLLQLHTDPPNCGRRATWRCCFQDQLQLRMKGL